MMGVLTHVVDLCCGGVGPCGGVLTHVVSVDPCGGVLTHVVSVDPCAQC